MPSPTDLHIVNPEDGERRGTPEQIEAARTLAAELKLKAHESPAAMTAWRKANIKWAQLSIHKKRAPRTKSLAMARATAAERIARSATLEAAGIMEDTARVLRAGVNVYGKIASQELAEYLKDRLANGNAEEKRAAARDLMAIYEKSLTLLQMNRERARPRQAIATWPTEGEKS